MSNPANGFGGGRSTRRFHIKTYGCQMNTLDSERIAEHLVAAGHRPAPSPDTADIVILNTCHIREKASEKVFSELGRLRRRKSGPRPVIAVAGCVAQAAGAEILRRQPAVDFVVGPQAWHRLPAMLDAAFTGARKPEMALDFEPERKFAALGPRAPRRGAAAFLSVQEGCDKFCSFCVVPYTRGAEMSRDAEELVREARALVGGGARELTLLGQNVNAWSGRGDDGRIWDLARLLHRLAEIAGVELLRYTTSHPNDMTESLVSAHAEIDRLAPYLHLPVQSGSDRVLKAMNRGHTAEHYLDILDRMRAVRPDMAFSSDFIVGFPGETEEDFAATLALVERARFASAYSFRYSPRPGTPAAERPDRVAAEVAAERLSRLQTALATHKRRFNAAWVGRRLRVLLTGVGGRPGQLTGRSPHMQAVHVEAEPDCIGRFVDVDIIAATANSLSAVLAGGELAA